MRLDWRQEGGTANRKLGQLEAEVSLTLSSLSVQSASSVG